MIELNATAVENIAGAGWTAWGVVLDFAIDFVKGAIEGYNDATK